MPITVAEDKAVTVVTVKTDNKSIFPPWCQILGALCYSPVCYTVHKGLMQTKVTAVLGAIQITLGLLNIGLEAGISTDPAYWLGAMYITAGIITLFSVRFPCVCLVSFTGLVNIGVAALAVVGFGLYATDLQHVFIQMCMYGDNCINALNLRTGMDITLIILAFLQLCVCIKMAVLCMTALVNKKKEEVSYIYQPILIEDMTSPGA